jgi:hypothetical protein
VEKLETIGMQNQSDRDINCPLPPYFGDSFSVAVLTSSSLPPPWVQPAHSREHIHQRFVGFCFMDMFTYACRWRKNAEQEAVIKNKNLRHAQCSLLIFWKKNTHTVQQSVRKFLKNSNFSLAGMQTSTQGDFCFRQAI